MMPPSRDEGSLSVLQVIGSVSLHHGGPSVAMGMIEQALAAEGVRVETATTDDDGPDARVVRPAEVVEHGVLRRYFPRTIRPYTCAPSFPGWLRRHARDYDLIHVHAVFSHLPMRAAHIARRLGVPYVVRTCGILNGYGLGQKRWGKALSLRLIEGPALRGAAAVHVTAEAERAEVAAALSDDLAFAVIPLGVEAGPPGDAARFLARFPQLAGAGPRLLFLSRIDPKKNLKGLIDALPALGDLPGGPARLIVCGGGAADYVEALRQRALALGVAERVVWAGFVGGQDKADAFAAADLFVLPSYSENFGVAPVEALLAGVPCVLGEGVAIAGDIAAAGAGCSIPPTALGVEAAVRELLAADHATLAVAARRLAAERYAPAAMGRALVELYERIVRERRGVR